MIKLIKKFLVISVFFLLLFSLTSCKDKNNSSVLEESSVISELVTSIIESEEQINSVYVDSNVSLDVDPNYSNPWGDIPRIRDEETDISETLRSYVSLRDSSINKRGFDWISDMLLLKSKAYSEEKKI